MAHGITGDLPELLTTLPGAASERLPCLVDVRAVTAPDQVWATDITYIPLRKGFLYLEAVVDLVTGLLSWKAQTALTRGSACRPWGLRAFVSGGIPSIFHSDQGCQFTTTDVVERQHTERIRINWSGRKRCYDNVLIERLWRALTHEEVNVRAYEDGWNEEIGLARFLWRCCHARPDRSVGGRTHCVVQTETTIDPSRSELTITESALVQ